ncbi:MAG: DUF5995 family protein [Nocardioides sp.]|jgi:hypothetical protein
MSRTRLGLTGLASSLLLVVGLLGLVAAPASASTEAAPVRHSDCTTPLTSTQRAALLQASDTRTLRTFADAKARLDVIESTFSATRDHRGIFAIFYRQILVSGAGPVSDASRWQYPTWVERVSRNFVVAYLDNLRGYLTGGTMTREWRSYYAMASDCNRSVGRVAAEGLIAHLVIDFPEAIRLANTRVAQQQDFFAIGDLLVDATVGLTADVERVYGQDLSPLFRLFWFGDAVDLLAGTPIITPVFFQAVRLSAWVDGLMLNDWFLATGTRWSMRTKFLAAETALDSMETFHLI